MLQPCCDIDTDGKGLPVDVVGVVPELALLCVLLDWVIWLVLQQTMLSLAYQSHTDERAQGSGSNECTANTGGIRKIHIGSIQRQHGWQICVTLQSAVECHLERQDLISFSLHLPCTREGSLKFKLPRKYQQVAHQECTESPCEWGRNGPQSMTASGKIKLHKSQDRSSHGQLWDQPCCQLRCDCSMGTYRGNLELWA